jgi:YHS domain-containing protein
MKLFSIFIVFALTLGAFALWADETQTQEKSQVVPVKSENVCMVNNRAFDKEQIPIQVEGRTYYGCCEMCKKALAEQKDLRVSMDPVSGKEVDKSVAVIGALPDGTTLYFENEDNLKKYNESQKQ